MKDLCKLVDGTLFEVEDITLGNIDTYCDSEEAAIELCSKITPENVSKIQFYTQYEDGTENELIVEYDSVSIASLPSRTSIGGQVLVNMGFAVPDADKEAIEINQQDITDIQMALAEIYEILDTLMSEGENQNG